MSRFLSEFAISPHPYMLLDPGPGLRIVDVNDSYARATMTGREYVNGKPLFEIFPDNPDCASADGVNNLYASLEIAARTGRPHTMPIQRYDVRDPNGHFVERYWSPTNTPLFDEDQHLAYLLHHVEDVTSDVCRGETQGRSGNNSI